MNIAFFLTPKSQVSFIYSDSTFRQGLEKLKRSGFSEIPVLSRDGSYLGTVSEGDFLWSLVDLGGASMRDCESLRIGGLIRTDRTGSVKITADVSELVDTLLGHNFVAVTDDRGCFMGIVTRHTLLDHFRRTSTEDISK